jgi:hypothetical protein
MWHTSAGQWPARPAERWLRDWNKLDGTGTIEMFEKVPVKFEERIAKFEKIIVLLQILVHHCSTYQYIYVCTKYPDLVRPVGIPDDGLKRVVLETVFKLHRDWQSQNCPKNNDV